MYVVEKYQPGLGNWATFYSHEDLESARQAFREHQARDKSSKLRLVAVLEYSESVVPDEFVIKPDKPDKPVKLAKKR